LHGTKVAAESEGTNVKVVMSVEEGRKEGGEVEESHHLTTWA